MIDGNTTNTTKTNAQNGGGIYMAAGALSFSGTIQNCKTDADEDAEANGGAVYVATGATMNMPSGTIKDSTAKTNGGAIYNASAGTTDVSGFTMTGGKIKGNSATSGGAVYVVGGATAEVTGGEITGNTVRTVTNGEVTSSVSANKGAGICLADGAKLNISGSPVFDNNIVKDTDNYPGDPIKSNGQDNTAYSSGNVRQDIYLTGSATPIASIVVTGALNVSNGSIWVWPSDSAHYKMLTQFATFAESLIKDNKVVFPNVATDKQSKALESTYLAFRNARDDGETECGGEYLTGQEGDTPYLIKWTGGFDFVFRKIDGNGNAFKEKDSSDNPLVVPKFTLYLAVKNSDGKLVPVKKGTKGTPAENLNATAWDDTVWGAWEAYQQLDKTDGVKKDATGKSQTILESAPVTVKEYVEGDKPVDRQVYGEGLVPFEKIPPGDYFMVETTKPDGWQSMFDVYRVYVDGAGWISITPVEKDATGKQIWPASAAPTAPAQDYTTKFVSGTNEKYTWSETIPTGAATMDVYNIMNVSTVNRKVILRKVDKDNFASLSGAHFHILRADLSEYTEGQPTGKTWYESGASAAFFIGKLPFGTYYLVETVAPTAPAGYNKTTGTGCNIGKVFKLTVDKDTLTSPGISVDNTNLVHQLTTTGTEDVMIAAFRRTP